MDPWRATLGLIPYGVNVEFLKLWFSETKRPGRFNDILMLRIFFERFHFLKHAYAGVQNLDINAPSGHVDAAKTQERGPGVARNSLKNIPHQTVHVCAVTSAGSFLPFCPRHHPKKATAYNNA